MQTKTAPSLLFPIALSSLFAACHSQAESTGRGEVNGTELTLPAIPGRLRAFDPDSDFELVMTRSGARLVDGDVVSDDELRTRLLEWRERSGLGVFDAPGGRIEACPTMLQPCELILRADHRLEVEHLRDLLKLLQAEPLWIYDFCFACAPAEGQGGEVQRVVPCSLEGGMFNLASGQIEQLEVTIRRTEPASPGAWTWSEDQVEVLVAGRPIASLPFFRAMDAEVFEEGGSELKLLSKLLDQMDIPQEFSFLALSPERALLADFVRVVESVNRGRRREISYGSAFLDDD